MFITTDLTHALQSIPWFLELKPFQIDRLSKVASIRQLTANEELFHEGNRSDNFFILLEGKVAVEIQVPSRGATRILVAEPLDILGWSVLTPVVRQRTATAFALEPSRLIVFEGEALRHLCDEDHDIGYFLMRRVANVVASRLLITRLQLYDVLLAKSQYPTNLE
jgi:CRP/FNR family transcriptional regulator, cyclic AMP receptor protein